MEHSLGSYPNATVLNYMHVGLIDSRTKRKRRIEEEERKVPDVDIYIEGCPHKDTTLAFEHHIMIWKSRLFVNPSEERSRGLQGVIHRKKGGVDSGRMGKLQRVKKIQRARDVLHGLGNLREDGKT